ncbi:hypothetical protein J3459_022535 [Metarhizium acridum]|nr:hypothetical protein J3459_022535 [Metarhizium acridum]
MKAHIKKSNLDLFDVWQAMKHAIANQLKELKHIRASQQLRTPLDVSGLIFEAVRGRVSHDALRKVQGQRQLCLQEPRQILCSQTFTSSHGLPCSHTLEKLEEEAQGLLLEHFHPHWHLKRGVALPKPVLEPRRAANQLNRTQPLTSTRREPSGFERIQGNRKAPTCSACHVVGHIMTSRSCPLKFKGSPVVPLPEARSSVTFSGATAEMAPAGVSKAPPEIVPTTQQSQCSNAVADALAEIDQPSSFAARMPPIRSSPLMRFNTSTDLGSLATSNNAPGSPPMLTVEGPTVEQVQSLSGVTLEEPRYDSPGAIYERYVAARNAWYAAQPAGSIKTNQQYRKAMGLPQRYDKRSYEWCLDYKQMSKHRVTATGSREWTKEEMMAYLDWSNQEDERIEAQVAREMGDHPLANKRRGMKEIWKRIEVDSNEQQALHSANSATEDCIVVKL